MARQKSTRQVQLSFPELHDPDFAETLAPSDVPPVVSGPREAPAREATAAPAVPVAPKPPRARSTPARMALVRNDAADKVSEPAEASAGDEPLPADPGRGPAVSPVPLAAPRQAPAGQADEVGDDAPGQRTGPRRRRLKTLSDMCVTLAAVGALGTVLWVGAEVVDTQKAQREHLQLQALSLRPSEAEARAERNSRAVELYLRYTDLVLQSAAAAPKGTKREVRHAREYLALSLLESLSTLTRGHPEWDHAVLSALERHVRFIREQPLPCGAYAADYVQLLEKVSGSRSTLFCRGD
jgi:hypothetical protein